MKNPKSRSRYIRCPRDGTRVYLPKGIVERRCPTCWGWVDNPSKCEFTKLCRGKVTHRILTKLGDFYVCSKHAKEASGHKDVRYIVPFKNPMSGYFTSGEGSPPPYPGHWTTPRPELW